MSKATKRKHVTREVLEDFVEPTQEQQIVKVSLAADSAEPSSDGVYVWTCTTSKWLRGLDNL